MKDLPGDFLYFSNELLDYKTRSVAFKFLSFFFHKKGANVSTPDCVKSAAHKHRSEEKSAIRCLPNRPLSFLHVPHSKVSFRTRELALHFNQGVVVKQKIRIINFLNTFFEPNTWNVIYFVIVV